MRGQRTPGRAELKKPKQHREEADSDSAGSDDDSMDFSNENRAPEQKLTREQMLEAFKAKREAEKAALKNSKVRLSCCQVPTRFSLIDALFFSPLSLLTIHSFDGSRTINTLCWKFGPPVATFIGLGTRFRSKATSPDDQHQRGPCKPHCSCFDRQSRHSESRC